MKPNLTIFDDFIESRSIAIAADIAKAFSQGKIYREPGLTIYRVAQLIDHPPYLISKLIKKTFNRKFNDYVNSFRVGEVIEHLSDDTLNRYTIEGLAKDVGFKSLSSFYEAFRKETGKTPIELYKSNKKTKERPAC